MKPRGYLRDAARIYAESFATIRAEADLTRLAVDLEPVAVRIIHACGDVAIASDIAASGDFVQTARQVLRAGAAIWCDSEMLTHGIIRDRLPAANPIYCTLNDARTPPTAFHLGTTRSAAAVDVAAGDGVLDGAVAVVGNAPTALFRLLELATDGRARPAAVVGVPVGFVGAAESKQLLATNAHKLPWLTVGGRRGGSAIAAAIVNALSQPDRRTSEA